MSNISGKSDVQNVMAVDGVESTDKESYNSCDTVTCFCGETVVVAP